MYRIIVVVVGTVVSAQYRHRRIGSLTVVLVGAGNDERQIRSCAGTDARARARARACCGGTGEETAGACGGGKCIFLAPATIVVVAVLLLVEVEE